VSELVHNLIGLRLNIGYVSHISLQFWCSFSLEFARCGAFPRLLALDLAEPPLSGTNTHCAALRGGELAEGEVPVQTDEPSTRYERSKSVIPR
jgi:hypothetical protein